MTKEKCKEKLSFPFLPWYNIFINMAIFNENLKRRCAIYGTPCMVLGSRQWRKWVDRNLIFQNKKIHNAFLLFYYWIYRNVVVILVLHKFILSLKPWYKLFPIQVFRLIPIICINLEMVKNQVSLHTKVTVIHYRKD